MDEQQDDARERRMANRSAGAGIALGLGLTVLMFLVAAGSG